MRNAQKKQVNSLVKLLSRAHSEFDKILEIQNAAAMSLLEQCQKGAIKLGELIEQAEGEDCAVISLLEEYCETVYQVYENIRMGGETNPQEMLQMLTVSFSIVEKGIEAGIEVRKEIVFLPYQASKWGFMESVWEAAREDAACDVYVIPIPYYYKNLDGSFQEMQYDGERYPVNVPITKYDEFDFGSHQPDLIIIQNPYDEFNPTVSVHPFFYSANVKQFTDKLIYIPCFVTDDIRKEDERAVEGMNHFAAMPGVVNADKIVVQSESMRQAYIDFLTKKAGLHSKEVWERKIRGLGSPMWDKNKRRKIKTPNKQAEWMERIRKKDGTSKKAVLYGTSVSILLQYGEQYLKKLQNVFNMFRDKQNEVILWWHPQPLQTIREALAPRHMQMYLKYENLARTFREENWGIYDEDENEEFAANMCDAYYGDGSSMIRFFYKQKKPVLIQKVDL